MGILTAIFVGLTANEASKSLKKTPPPRAEVARIQQAIANGQLRGYIHHRRTRRHVHQTP